MGSIFSGWKDAGTRDRALYILQALLGIGIAITAVYQVFTEVEMYLIFCPMLTLFWLINAHFNFRKPGDRYRRDIALAVIFLALAGVCMMAE